MARPAAVRRVLRGGLPEARLLVVHGGDEVERDAEALLGDRVEREVGVRGEQAPALAERLLGAADVGGAGRALEVRGELTGEIVV